MATLAELSPKAERIEIRVTPNVKALLSAAAQARHTTVSEFLLTHGIEAAEHAVAAPRVVFASEAGFAAIQRLLDASSAPDPATVAWLAKPRR